MMTMKTFRKIAAPVVAIAIVFALLLVGTVGDNYATNSTKAVTQTVPTGFTSMASFTGTMRATVADTQYLPLAGNPASRDSVTLVVYTYTAAGNRTSFKVRLQQSANNVTWKTTTIGTDSTTYSTTASTLATALENDFQIGDARYGTWPYNRLLVTNPVTGTADSTKYVFYVYHTKSSQ